MEVHTPLLSGFCPGVKNAEKRILDLKQKFPGKTIYVLGYLINNRKYIQYLSSMQIFTTENIDTIPADSLVAIRTHGISRYEEEKVRKKYNTIDLTCRNVKKVQMTISEYSNNEYSVLITGKKHHPEVIGLQSYARESHIVENMQELESLIRDFKKLYFSLHKINKLLIISQTTGSRELFVTSVNKIREKWGNQVIIEYIDSICPVTDKKEEQALELQRNCDVSFVLGDRLSSNAQKLFLRLSADFMNVHFIEDLDMLKSLSLPLKSYNAALVVSSASTPVFIEKEVCDFLKEI